MKSVDAKLHCKRVPRRFRRCEIPAGVILRGLAADWYVKADRYILAYLAELARLAFAARFRATCFATASHYMYVRDLLNKFLTVIQTDFRFHAKCHSEADMVLK